ncbi:MAG: helix-turn-helix domain-containing protein [Lachnospiraceae bacterium]|nr:helix-turn-helix domain-containing protein [Lachnospiraceae bacterium]
MKIWENIFILLKKRGMSQKEFSKLTGISESTISDWKRKQFNPGVDKIPVICKVLGVSADELLGVSDFAMDYLIEGDARMIIERYRKLTPDMQLRIVAYMDKLAGSQAPGVEFRADNNNMETTGIVDKEFQIKKDLARKLRKLARLSRLRIDEEEHASGLNLHLYKYLDFLGLDRLEFVKAYLAHIQPYMICEMKSQEKFDNAVCVLDEYYRISVYIKVDSTKGEEIIVSFHENNKNGIARRNSLIRREGLVYVFADSIGSHIEGTDSYSVNLFIMRGVRTFPLSVSAVRYDADGFMVRLSDINNALIGISNQYLEDLYTSDLDISEIELFSSLQQLSFTSFGNDVFSNISILIDSLLIQKDAISRQIADAALCIYCSSVELIDSDKKELLNTLRARFSVNSVRALPEIIERIELNLS